jgi:hypothetical protein
MLPVRLGSLYRSGRSAHLAKGQTSEAPQLDTRPKRIGEDRPQETGRPDQAKALDHMGFAWDFL